MIMNVAQLMERELARATEVLQENQPHCLSVHHKSHMIWPGIESGPLRCGYTYDKMWTLCILPLPGTESLFVGRSFTVTTEISGIRRAASNVSRYTFREVLCFTYFRLYDLPPPLFYRLPTFWCDVKAANSRILVNGYSKFIMLS
jgi:hypothetical protein